MEMDYKKLYEEAVNKIKSIIAEKKSQGLTNCLFEGDLNEIFPELKESEDEKIRKDIIEHFKYEIEELSDKGEDYEAEIEELSKYIAWLEKQGEQKPAWSKEDITNYSKVLFCLQTLTFPTDAERKELITWLKKQCEQSSADGECKTKREAELNPAWSDDDELRFKKAIYIFHQNGYFDVENWLKSLKDRVQPTWKPTEEQLQTLKDTINHDAVCTRVDVLESLYNDLKKL